ncbi:MAG: septum site-determining protein MinC [Enterovibrio sp.]
MTKSAELKGSTFTFSVLQLFNDNFEQTLRMLEKKIELAPSFFIGAPLVLDISRLDKLPDLAELKNKINATGVLVVGLTGCRNDEWREAAKEAGVALVNLATPAKQAQQLAAPSKIVVSPIRSGQQIYAKNRDLVILNHVSAGAEIIADGNIHIYGSLRGRAIAGASGHKEAHIFCQNLQPELISIAGTYWLNETIPQNFLGCSVKVSLSDGSLLIEPI